MTPAQFDVALRAFCRRRPFSKFVIEFTSGTQVSVRHPEAVRRLSDLYTMRLPEGGSMLFVAECVARLLDVAASAPAN